MRKNWMTTIGGIMVALGTLPPLVTASHVAAPLWWNSCQFPLLLLGLIGGAMLGLAAKGQDEHSTESQVTVATAKSVMNATATAIEKDSKTSGG
jgi:hypothetical protein